MKILARLYAAIGFTTFLFGIFWLPKDVQDWQQAAAPWKRALSMVDQNTALWIFAIAALAYIIWIDIRPWVKALLQRKRVDVRSLKQADGRHNHHEGAAGGSATVGGNGTAIGGEGGSVFGGGALPSAGRGGDGRVEGDGLAIGGRAGSTTDGSVLPPPARNPIYYEARRSGLVLPPPVALAGSGGSVPGYDKMLAHLQDLLTSDNNGEPVDLLFPHDHVIEQSNRLLEENDSEWRVQMADHQIQFYRAK